MAISTTQNYGDFISKAIEASIKSRAEDIYEKYKEKMIKELEESKGEVVTGIVIHLMEQVEIKEFTKKLTLVIRKDKR